MINYSPRLVLEQIMQVIDDPKVNWFNTSIKTRQDKLNRIDNNGDTDVDGFEWSSTKQGEDYWREVQDQLRNEELELDIKPIPEQFLNY